VNLALATLGSLVVFAGTGIALARLDLSPGPVGQLLSDCGRFLLPHLTPESLVVLGLALLGAAVLARGLWSAIRQIRGCHEFVQALGVIGERQLDDPRVVVVSGSRAQAFCAGFIRPRVYVSRGARDLLSEAQLAAVVAHEAHHARRRDPLRILLVTVLADALFFLPTLRRLKRRYAELAELAADEAALSAVGDASPLAAALLQFGETGVEGFVGIDPERVDHLLGRAPRWELPTGAIVGALLTVVALLAVVLTSARSTAVAHVSLAQVAAQSCMIAMTAAPILALIGLWMLGRRTITRGR
jgi:BlaR1 peptidase M56